jgi:beta-lactam-binding protein with PASTA domain
VNWKKMVLIGAGVLVATFGIGYVVATRILFPPLPEPENGIAVPDLRGVIVAEASARLEPLGLRRGDQIPIAHPNQPPGIIVAQSPLPGQQLRQGDVVTVAVSSGLPRVQIPNVVGFDVERATAVLTQMGLETDQRSELNERPLGTVLRIIPEPGQRQPVPSRVLLIVSAGPPPTPAPDANADSTVRADTLILRL